MNAVIPGGLLRLGLAALAAAGLTGCLPERSIRWPAFTGPVPDEIIWTGQPYLVAWDGGTDNHRVLTLFAGDEVALFAVQTISAAVDGSSGQFVWLVPPDLQPGRYALGLGPRPGAGTSGMFEVVSSGGAVPVPHPRPLALAG
ncbi:Ser-Thr-rich GPI-anchored membrane family protein [Kitasatospora sp. NPDC054768]